MSVIVDGRAEQVYLGECHLHGYHGRTVCQTCRDSGQVALLVKVVGSGEPGRFRLAHVNSSLLRFQGGGRMKLRQEARCRACLRPKGPDSIRESQLDEQHNVVGSRPLTRHHLIPEKWFKRQLAPTRAVRSVDANIVPLCRPCHVLVEKDEEARRMLRRVLGSDEVAFMIQLATEDWVNAKYPPSQG